MDMDARGHVGEGVTQLLRRERETREMGEPDGDTDPEGKPAGDSRMTSEKKK